MKLKIIPIKHLKSKNEYLESIVEMKEVEESVLINQLIFFIFCGTFENQKRPT